MDTIPHKVNVTGEQKTDISYTFLHSLFKVGVLVSEWQSEPAVTTPAEAE
jgi:hypothetical protein